MATCEPIKTVMPCRHGDFSISETESDIFKMRSEH